MIATGEPAWCDALEKGALKAADPDARFVTLGEMRAAFARVRSDDGAT